MKNGENVLAGLTLSKRNKYFFGLCQLNSLRDYMNSSNKTKNV